MPKQTYFNLPAEKQQIIVQAAQKEFSRVPLAEASIANIVKDAKIARGSFYQYFADKEDLYFYLLSEHGKENHTALKSALQNNDGDLFQALRDVHCLMLQKLEQEELRSFYRNIFMNLDYRTEKAFVELINAKETAPKFEEMMEYVDTTPLNIKDEQELTCILEIIVSIIMQNYVLKFAHNLSNEQLIAKYEQKITLLKRGFIKR